MRWIPLTLTSFLAPILAAATPALSVKELAFPAEDCALETLTRDIVAVGRFDGRVIAMPRGRTFAVEAPFRATGNNNAEMFGSIAEQKRLEIAKPERIPPDVEWRAVDIRLGKGLVFDGTALFFIETDPTTFAEVSRRGLPWDTLKPPRDRGGEGTAGEIAGFRASFAKAFRGTLGVKIAGLGPIVRSPTSFSPETTTVGDQTIATCKPNYTSKSLDGSSRTIIKSELRYRTSDSTAVSGFIDSGAVFFSQDQMEKFQRAYKDPVDTKDEDPACADVRASRSVEDNIGYDYSALVRNPGYLWSRHYYSYGAAFSLLTALGSVNLAYGLPWHEPTTEACQDDPEFCYPRGKTTGHWITRGEFSLDVGARF